jgi:hypothetical protein
MKIGRRLNTLTQGEYFHYITNHKKYTDFNTLGLYRSITENEKLDTEQKKEVRDFAHRFFKKTFEFLQLKDPGTYFGIVTLGEDLTIADEEQLWKNIIANQQKILADKRIKHRNFGHYSKHNCGYDNCPYNGIRIRQGSGLADSCMQFRSDNNNFAAKEKSKGRRKQRKKFRNTVGQLMPDDL